MSAISLLFMLATMGGVVAINVFCVATCLRGKKK